MTRPSSFRQEGEKLSYTVVEACGALGIGRTSLYELIRTGELATFKLAGRTLIAREDMQALINRHRHAA